MDTPGDYLGDTGERAGEKNGDLTDSTAARLLQLAGMQEAKGAEMFAQVTDFEQDVHELAYRVADGVEVALLWVTGTDRALVVVHDERTGEVLELEVGKGENALDVFNHPYAYAAARGFEYQADLREPVYA
jgi:hypothetical protein